MGPAVVCCYSRSDHVLGGLWKEFKFLTRRITECKQLCGMFCGNSEDKNIESSTEDGDLTSEVSEGSLKILSVPFLI